MNREDIMLNEISQTQVNSVFYISIESGNFYMEFGGGRQNPSYAAQGKLSTLSRSL